MIFTFDQTYLYLLMLTRGALQRSVNVPCLIWSSDVSPYIFWSCYFEMAVIDTFDPFLSIFSDI